jgi:hypothetical protein
VVVKIRAKYTQTKEITVTRTVQLVQAIMVVKMRSQANILLLPLTKHKRYFRRTVDEPHKPT